nr:integrase, catalytic region, zinc finger, CCHC-type, peptidase aspartic, catalytic [Tanacetum cinerariifolium]
MDSIISLGQKNTLAEYMILSDADNLPPMLDKDLYDSWKSRKELYIQNKEHGRMILESFEHGPLIWHTVEENGLHDDIYSLVNHHRVAKDLWERVQLLMQATSLTKHEREYLGFAVPVFSPGDDPIACLNKAMAFLTVVASSRVTVQQVQGRQGKNYFGTTYKGNATSSRGNTISGHARVIKCYNCPGEGHIARQCTQPKRPRNASWFKEKAMLAKAQEVGLILDGEKLSFFADLGTAQAVLMANISNYDSDVISEVPNSETYLNDMDNQRLKAQVQDKVFVITSLKNDLRKLRGKATVDNATQKPSATTVAPGMFKLDLEPFTHKLVHNKEIHINYLKHTQEQADILRGIVEQAKAKQPLDNALYFSGVSCSTSASGSKPSGNTKNNRISQSSSSNKINKVEDQPRSVKTRKNKKIMLTKLNDSVNDVTSSCLCAICGKCMIAETYHACVHLVVTKMNKSQKSKLVKKHKNQNVWKPTGNVFTDVGCNWKPTGQTFTIVGNSCPLTRFTSTNVVPHKQTPSHSVEIQKLEIKVYSRKPKNVNNAGLSKMAKIVESKNANHSEPNHTWGFIATDIPSSSSLVMTGCLDCTLIARIMRYGDYQLGNVIIPRVYFVEGLGHNLFSVGQFCNTDLGVAFWKNTCFIRNLEGVDLILGSRDTNLYIISLDGMLKSSPIYLLSKTSKTKSWLWHRRLSHLNFGKFDAKADIRIFVGYAPAKKAFRIYSRRTRIISETIHVTDDWDRLFQPMFDEYFNPPTIAVSLVQKAVDPIAKLLGDSPVSISINQDAPSTSIPSSQEQEHSPIISQGFDESPKIPMFHDFPLNESPQDSTSQGSSSNLIQIHIPFEHLGAVDPTLFTRHARNILLLVQIYVNNILFSSTNTAMCDEFANQMTNKFKMSMMGQMSFFLGLQISQSPKGIFINQSKYASEIVKKYGLNSTDSVDTPMIENEKLDKDLQGKQVDLTLAMLSAYVPSIRLSLPKSTYKR